MGTSVRELSSDADGIGQIGARLGDRDFEILGIELRRARRLSSHLLVFHQHFDHMPAETRGLMATMCPSICASSVDSTF